MRIHIIGGGLSGCTLSYFLKNNFDITIYEKESSLGGLCQTQYNLENIPYQYGSHILHTNEMWVIDLLSKFIPMQKIDYRVAINPLFDFNYYDFPLTLESLQKMPWHWNETIKLELEKITGNNANNLKDLIINFYGKTVYKLFFKNYIHKLLNSDPRNIKNIDWFRPFLKSIDDNYSYFNERNIYFPVDYGYNNLFLKLTEGVKINYCSEVTINDIPKDDIIICTVRPDLFILKKEILKYIKFSFDIDSILWDSNKPDSIIYPNYVPYINITQYGKYFKCKNNKNIITKQFPNGNFISYPLLKKAYILSYNEIVNENKHIYFAGVQGSFQILSMSDCIIQTSKLAAKIKLKEL